MAPLLGAQTMTQEDKVVMEQAKENAVRFLIRQMEHNQELVEAYKDEYGTDGWRELGDTYEYLVYN